LDSALLAAKKTVELVPEGYREWSTLSQVLMKRKAYDEALKAADKALALAPTQPPNLKDNIKKTIDQIKAAQAEKK
jgi:cytochrome c-type biogenesis protein CcmH/NrfG